MCLLILGIALLIAWRAGDHAPNIAIALSLTFIYGSIVVALLFDRLHVMPLIRQIVQMLLFFLALCPLHPLVTALSAQADGRGHRFEPDDLGQIAATAKGGGIPAPPCSRLDHFGDCNRGDPVHCRHPRVPPHVDGHHRDRHSLFLHHASRAGRRGQAQGAVVLRGGTRSSHHHDRSAGALDLALGDSITPDVRAVIQLIFNIVNGLIMVICFAAAVFYAGAISPALIVRKTLVYSATVGLLVFLCAVVEIYVAHSLIHALHVNDRFASAVLGAIFGFAFHPLKHRIEHFLKRFAPKDKAGVEPAAVAKPA